MPSGNDGREQEKNQELTPTLRCALSPARKLELEEQLLQATLELERLGELYKRLFAEHKALVQRHQQQQAVAAHVLGAGFEMRPTRCQRVLDERTKVYKIIRTDTREVVSERPLTEQDLEP
jgi:hypothetical protein